MKKHTVGDKISKYTSLFENMVLAGEAATTFERSLNVEKKGNIEEANPIKWKYIDMQLSELYKYLNTYIRCYVTCHVSIIVIFNLHKSEYTKLYLVLIYQNKKIGK